MAGHGWNKEKKKVVTSTEGSKSRLRLEFLLKANDLKNFNFFILAVFS